ncbi:MAG: hypothetical protein R3305_07490 [Gammaproteobacteria bacterium]|nr:hypothetical protein [Gammaproteobacteria bacterium]
MLALPLLGAVPNALAQAPPPSAFPGQAPASPPADILLFRAEAAGSNGASDAGERLQLRWEAINAYAVEIVPDIGPVPTFGTRSIAPVETTTYTLRVTGAGGVVTESVTVQAVAADSVASAATDPVVPAARALRRHADGTIDLSGLYIGGRAIRLVDDVRLTAAAAEAEAAARDNDLGQGVLCVPPGVPNATLMPFPLQIVHTPELVVILYEAYHLFRIIPIGREHPDYLDPTWMGYSVADWEGDTLVVTVKGFNDKSRIAGFAHTTDMVVTERYTPTGSETIRYEAVVEDPAVFAEPVRYAGDLTLRPEWEIGEYVCAENSKDYDALL